MWAQSLIRLLGDRYAGQPWRRYVLIHIGILGWILFAELAQAREHLASRPNFVFLLVDDLGWADVGCFGSTFYETPHIDDLAARGMKFTQAYAACPVCSPTRASILTGRHPVRVNITDWIPGMSANQYANPRFLHVDDRDNLALAEVTFAEVLKDYGYQTFFAGKWHLGDRGHWPTDQGFDVNVGGNSKGSPPGGYYAPWSNPTLEAREPNEYLTERLTDEAVAFLRSRDSAAPFLLYLAYYNVHTPITPYAKRVGQFREKAAGFDGPTPTRREHLGQTRLRQDNPDYASMIAAVDDSVGRLMEELDELSLSENTVICFFSDNGGLSTMRRPGPTSNLPLRAGKGWLYEGGIREPMIVCAPGVAAAGASCDVPVVSMDFFPTILELAGLPARADLHCDGQSFLDLLAQRAMPAERTFYWHYPHYHGSTWTPGAAIRRGHWKLIEFYEWNRVELYNLDHDPGETLDLSEQAADRREALRAELRRWQLASGAQLPVANPAFHEKTQRAAE